MAIFDEKDFLACCGSSKFAQEMVLAGPFTNYHQAVDAARDIWFNKVDVPGWLEAFAVHPQIGETSSGKNRSPTSAQWSKGEQSAALATATGSSLKELFDWNLSYRQKFGFVFVICASGRSTPEILAEIKRRYPNRPIFEFEIAAQEQMKITELRLAKLFSVETDTASIDKAADIATKGGEHRMNYIGSHLTAIDAATEKPSPALTGTRPPITTHVLDTAQGCLAAGIEVRLEERYTQRESTDSAHSSVPDDNAFFVEAAGGFKGRVSGLASWVRQRMFQGLTSSQFTPSASSKPVDVLEIGAAHTQQESSDSIHPLVPDDNARLVEAAGGFKGRVSGLASRVRQRMFQGLTSSQSTPSASLKAVDVLDIGAARLDIEIANQRRRFDAEMASEQSRSDWCIDLVKGRFKGIIQSIDYRLPSYGLSTFWTPKATCTTSDR